MYAILQYIACKVLKTKIEEFTVVASLFIFFVSMLVLNQFVVPSNNRQSCFGFRPPKHEQRKMLSNITITACLSFPNHKMKSKWVLFNIGCLIPSRSLCQLFFFFVLFVRFNLICTHAFILSLTQFTFNTIDQDYTLTITNTVINVIAVAQHIVQQLQQRKKEKRLMCSIRRNIETPITLT